MLDTVDGEIDPIEEFQIRRWARENYVSARERDALWHPIALDEMRRKDQEIAEHEALARRAYAIVPLAPDEPMRRDVKHLGPNIPKLLLAVAEVPTERV